MTTGTVFGGDQAWIAHQILRNLDIGKSLLSGLNANAEDVAKNLIEEGFVSPVGTLTPRGRFAAAYPHLAKNAKIGDRNDANYTRRIQ